MIQEHLLSWIVFSPLIALPLILILPKRSVAFVRWITLLAITVPLLLSIWLYFLYNINSPVRPYSPGLPDLQFIENVSWIPMFNIYYFVGVDGLSLPMVILTTVVSFVGVIASWNIPKEKAYFSLYIFLYVGMMGVFVALDFFLFYIFWEVMLLPMYFLIGIWGGPRREYAAIKFFLYTLFGSVFMLIIMIAFWFFSDVDPDPNRVVHSFNLIELSKPGTLFGPFQIGAYARTFAWLALFLGFAIKIPAFPFHTWLPDAHVEAPTAISVILAGVLLKMGTYGILRINYFILPQETAELGFYFLAALGVVNIIYGALAAMAQNDLKKLIAYSSVSHMGFVMLGMGAFNTAGLNGAVFQMFNHGTITSMLFLLVGVVYDRAHHRNIDGFGGLASIVPKYTSFTAFAFFAGLGLPGLSGFISEALCFLGGFERYPVLTMISVSGVVLTAAYLLWAMQRVFLGPPNEEYKDLEEINIREVISLLPVGAFVLVFGIYPVPMLDLMGPSLLRIEALIKPFLN